MLAGSSKNLTRFFIFEVPRRQVRKTKEINSFFVMNFKHDVCKLLKLQNSLILQTIHPSYQILNIKNTKTIQNVVYVVPNLLLNFILIALCNMGKQSVAVTCFFF